MSNIARLRRSRRVGAGLVLGLALTAMPALVATATAAGDGYEGGRHAAPRYVVAESHWGRGTITGAVRPGPHGYQVRLPRGTWIDCVRSCSDTLRRATVDFWQNNGPQAAESGRGYLRWEFSY